MKQLQSRLERVNDKISKGLWQYETSRSVLDKELDDIDRYNDEIRRCTRLLERRVSLLRSSSSNNSVSNQIKLLQLPLPQYSYAPGLWRHFFVISKLLYRNTLLVNTKNWNF